MLVSFRCSNCLFVYKAVPGSGIWFWWSGKDLISAEKCPCQAPTRPAGQQPSQASCPLLLYPHIQRLLEKSRWSIWNNFWLFNLYNSFWYMWRTVACFFLTFLWRYHWDMPVCDLAPPRVLLAVLHSHRPQRLTSARLQRSAVSQSSLQSLTSFGLFQLHDSFIAFCLDPSGSRGLSVSRVSRQDLEQVHYRSVSFFLFCITSCKALWFSRCAKMWA